MSGFDKTIPSTIAEYKIYDADSTSELVKQASSDVDLPEGFQYDPDYLYLWIRIVSSGNYYGPNKNGDYFPTEELVEYYETFNEAHPFKNHENKKVENAIGKIFSVRWNPVMKTVEIFKGIDRKLAPSIVRGYEKGHLTDVSMGCKVPYTVCSVCGNKARRQTEFCDHVKNYRMQYLGNGERVFEINYAPKFHDSSAVLNGAERVAKAMFIYTPPEEGETQNYEKVASSRGVSTFTHLSDHEMEKVASFENEFIHPLLRPSLAEKVANDNPYLTKIAELEKEVTGKLLNIVSDTGAVKSQSADQLIQIIKFLTEKRLDEGTLKDIALSLSEMAKSEGVSTSKAFSTFLSVAELMGIELFPTELHTILCEITNSKVEKAMSLSESEGNEVYPSDFARGVKESVEATDQLPQFKDTSDFFNAYNEIPFTQGAFNDDPFGFLESTHKHDDLEEEASPRIVKLVRNTLEPFMPMRSREPEHLLPRLSVVLGGHRSIIGNNEARRDLDVISNPHTLGDLMAMISYSNYQQMRPKLLITKMVKSAQFYDSELEKYAVEGNKPYRGIKKRKIAMVALPAAYGASLFQKSRAENGNRLTDGENFLASHPGVIAGGAILAGKPLSAKVVQAAVGAKNVAGKVGTVTKDQTSAAAQRMKKGFDKLTHEEYVGLVKIADSLDSGQFNAMDDEMLNRFSKDYRLTPQETAVIKMATLFSIGGMDKEASALLDKHDLPMYATGEFLKQAAIYASEGMDKAAGDFVNALTIDGLMDKRNLTRTAHGRMIDALVFKKIGDKFGDAEAKIAKGGELNVPK